MQLQMKCTLELLVMNRAIVAIGIVGLIISSLVFISVLLGMVIPSGYLSVRVIVLFVAGIVLILWSLRSKKKIHWFF